jgi:hypothetical protein
VGSSRAFVSQKLPGAPSVASSKRQPEIATIWIQPRCGRPEVHTLRGSWDEGGETEGRGRDGARVVICYSRGEDKLCVQHGAKLIYNQLGCLYRRLGANSDSELYSRNGIRPRDADGQRFIHSAVHGMKAVRPRAEG